MNLGEIEASWNERFGYPVTADSATTRRSRRYINTTHREILGMRAFARLRRWVLTATSTASSPFMVLPQAAVAIAVMVDRTNQRPLDEVSLQDIRYMDPGLTNATSNPVAYAILNYAASTAIDPSAAASLYVISDAAEDGSGLSATIEGVITGGYVRRGTVAMNGLTGVNLSSTISTWTHVTKFRLSGAAKGNVTLREGSGVGTELARITPGRANARYTQLHLIGTPTTPITYYCDVELHVDDMSHVQDESLLPEDFTDLLEIGATMKELKKREKTSLWQIENQLWRTRIADLRAFMAKRGGVAHGPNRRQVGWSQLGGNFPAGS